MVFLFYNPSIEYLCNYLHNESESWSQREMTLNLTNGVFCLCVRERTSGNVCKLYCCSCLWFFISTSNQFSIQDFSKGIYTNICFSIHVLNNFDTRIYSKLQNQVPAYENTVQVDLKLIPCYQKIVDLINDKPIIVSKEESYDFQKTCNYFNLRELRKHTEIYFMKGTF